MVRDKEQLYSNIPLQQTWCVSLSTNYLYTSSSHQSQKVPYPGRTVTFKKMSEEVIELSVEDTNKLRAELGLSPLRFSNSQAPPQSTAPPFSETTNDREEVLEISVDETNALREKLGLPPLRTTSNKKDVIHKPAENKADTSAIIERIAEAKLRRQVQAGVKKTFGEATLADDVDISALSWAERMRMTKEETVVAKASKKSKETKGKLAKYDGKDLEGLHVAHNLNDLEAGATTVLTLADTPLLSSSLDETTSKITVGLNDDAAALENVNLAEQKKQHDGLRKKRLLELGMGRAGGYAGFDDEEFEELGGTMGPSKRDRGNPLLDDPMDEDMPTRGFRIGGSIDRGGASSMTDFDKIQMGKAVSLVPEKADVASSDYLTLEEEEAERAARKKTKDGKFTKKKKSKKGKKHRKTLADSGDEGADDEEPSMVPFTSGNININLLETLEAAAPASSGLRKRHRTEDDDDDNDEATKPTPVDSAFVIVKQGTNATVSNQEDKRAKFDAIMAKGNERTKQAFSTRKKEPEKDVMDEATDDSFLNAALAKARRLNRLRELNKPAKGADAVVEALKASVAKDQARSTSNVGSSGGITFIVDDTREFTLALQARAQQTEREAEKGKHRANARANQLIKIEEDTFARDDDNKADVVVKNVASEDVDMEELAKEVKTDDLDDTAFEGSTARSAGVGRGLSSFISMLKTTGEISDKNAKEELKGRAKDERHYEHYAPVDLSKVVKIGRNATAKDRELANREIKLEYRDKHGRLLTTKEAYRDLCYQFHGHGASKKKEDKRLKQIEREQAQTRMASQQVAAARDGSTASTFGALKATQKATGKAFIVHKT
jgi:U4/U6.U5 tri-snRNP-associated protein 1